MEIEPIAPKIQERLNRKRVQIAIVQQRQEALTISINTRPQEPDLSEVPFGEQDEVFGRYLDAVDEFVARRERMQPLLESARNTVADRLQKIETITLESFIRNEQRFFESPEEYGVNSYQVRVGNLKTELRLKAKIDLDRMEEIEKERDQRTQATVVPAVKQDIQVEAPKVEESEEVVAAPVEEIVIAPEIEEEVEQVKPAQVIENVGVLTKEEIDRMITEGPEKNEIEPHMVGLCFARPYPVSVQTNGSLQPEQPREKTMDEKIADGEPIWEEKDGVVVVKGYELQGLSYYGKAIAKRLGVISPEVEDVHVKNGKTKGRELFFLGAYSVIELAGLVWDDEEKAASVSPALKLIEQSCRKGYPGGELMLKYAVIANPRPRRLWYFSETKQPEPIAAALQPPVDEAAVVEPVKKKTKKQTRV